MTAASAAATSPLRGRTIEARVLLVLGVISAQLGFLGNPQYPLWALTALALNVVVLFALTVRWDETKPDLLQ